MEIKGHEISGKKSKMFFDYLEKNNLNVNLLTVKDMLKISLETRLKYSYVKMLKSRYKIGKMIVITIEDINFALQKFNVDYNINYDIFDKIDSNHKKIMCKYLSEKYGQNVGIYMFDGVIENL